MNGDVTWTRFFYDLTSTPHTNPGTTTIKQWYDYKNKRERKDFDTGVTKIYVSLLPPSASVNFSGFVLTVAKRYCAHRFASSLRRNPRLPHRLPPRLHLVPLSSTPYTHSLRSFSPPPPAASCPPHSPVFHPAPLSPPPGLQNPRRPGHRPPPALPEPAGVQVPHG